MDAFETISYKGHTIELFYDDEPTNPREWDNVGELVQLSTINFSQPDKDASLESEILAAWERTYDYALLERYLRVCFDVVAFDVWDDPRSSSRVVGYITRKKAFANWDAFGYDYREYAQLCIKGELETYAQWSHGEVYAYRIDEDWSESCGGFFSDDEAMLEARATIDSMIKQAHVSKVTMFKKLVDTGVNH